MPCARTRARTGKGTRTHAGARPALRGHAARNGAKPDAGESTPCARTRAQIRRGANPLPNQTSLARICSPHRCQARCGREHALCKNQGPNPAWCQPPPEPDQPCENTQPATGPSPVRARARPVREVRAQSARAPQLVPEARAQRIRPQSKPGMSKLTSQARLPAFALSTHTIPQKKRAADAARFFALKISSEFQNRCAATADSARPHSTTAIWSFSAKGRCEWRRPPFYRRPWPKSRWPSP